jgi:plasmid stabilization system protein ParE
LKSLAYHPEASKEIDKVFSWYAMRSTQAADGFYEELFPLVNRVRHQPGLFPVYVHGTRKAVLDCYPFSVVFREFPRKIQIIAVAHAKRRPGYWASGL